MKALQHPAELVAFTDLVRREGVRSYLEIGSKYGGSFAAVTRTMPRGSRAVSVDRPSGEGKRLYSKIALQACVAELRRTGYDTHVVWGDSKDADVIRAVSQLGPFDLVFIDGDHELSGVRQDWANYGPLGRMVAFHDIAWNRPADWRGYIIDVPLFWLNIKPEYRHEEIRLDPSGRNNGIGILWR